MFFCKSKRAAYREYASVVEGKKLSDDLISSKKKISATFGDVLDTTSIDHVCQLICEKNKRHCISCKKSCDELVMSVLKIAHDAMKIKLHNQGLLGVPTNIVNPSSADTVLITQADLNSKACARSNGASAATIEKSCEGNFDEPHLSPKTCPAPTPAPEFKGIETLLHGVCVDTPVVQQPLLNSSPPSKSAPAIMHPLNKRWHLAIRDKLDPAPHTSLLSPKGLFDLHVSDDEFDDVKRSPHGHCSPGAVGGVCDSFVGVSKPAYCDMHDTPLKHNSPKLLLDKTTDFEAPHDSKCDPIVVRDNDAPIIFSHQNKSFHVPAVLIEQKTTNISTDATRGLAFVAPQSSDCNIFEQTKSSVKLGIKHNTTHTAAASTVGQGHVPVVSSVDGRHVSCTQPSKRAVASIFAGEPSLQCNHRSHLNSLVDKLYNERN